MEKYRLGNLLELLSNTNFNLEFGVDSVRGVNNLKKLMATKADLNGRDLSRFQIVRPGEFVFNHRTSRNGSKFSIAYNDEERPVICTEDYVVFRIKPDCTNIILADWLYMYFNRAEFDRFVITNSWGSSTEFYNWEDLCSIELIIPDLAIQKEYSNIYKSLIANLNSYENGTEDLEKTADMLLDKIKHNSPLIKIRDLLKEIDNRNTDETISNVHGININKQFMATVADVHDVNLSKYKIVNPGQIAFSGMQTGRDKCIRIALNRGNEAIAISPAYTVLQFIDDSVLPEYVLMWFSRGEIDRLGWFMSDSSIRSNLDLDSFFDMVIPVPELKIQQSLRNFFVLLEKRHQLKELIHLQAKEICRVLIKGSIDNSRKVQEVK